MGEAVLDDIIELPGDEETREKIWEDVTEAGIAPMIRRLHGLILDSSAVNGIYQSVKLDDTFYDVSKTHLLEEDGIQVTLNGKGRRVEIKTPVGFELVLTAEPALDQGFEESYLCNSPEVTVKETVFVSTKDSSREYTGLNVRASCKDWSVVAGHDRKKQTFTNKGGTVEWNNILGELYRTYQRMSLRAAGGVCRSRDELEQEDMVTEDLANASDGDLQRVLWLLKPREQHIPGRMKDAVPLSKLEPFKHADGSIITQDDLVDEIAALFRSRGFSMQQLAETGEQTGYKHGVPATKGFKGVYGLDTSYLWCVTEEVFADILEYISKEVFDAHISQWDTDDPDVWVGGPIKEAVVANTDRIAVMKHQRSMATILQSILPFYTLTEAMTASRYRHGGNHTTGLQKNYTECLLHPTRRSAMKTDTDTLRAMFTFAYWAKPKSVITDFGNLRINCLIEEDVPNGEAKNAPSGKEGNLYGVGIRVVGASAEPSFTDYLDAVRKSRDYRDI
ncbi:hypothetical protein KY362_00840 [Candidatus Woesearchaeota archaeon]|nr:hypothetical protein [Candidatus Woesearchaeota archaeon]